MFGKRAYDSPKQRAIRWAAAPSSAVTARGRLSLSLSLIRSVGRSPELRVPHARMNRTPCQRSELHPGWQTRRDIPSEVIASKWGEPRVHRVCARTLAFHPSLHEDAVPPTLTSHPHVAGDLVHC
jgi:hypothetical protein